MAMCEGRAEELLRAKSSVGDMTSAAIAKVLSTESQKTGTVCVINLRDFAKGYYSVSGSGYLPVLAAKAEAESGNSGSAGGRAGAFADGSEDAQNAGNSLAGGRPKRGRKFFRVPRPARAGFGIVFGRSGRFGRRKERRASPSRTYSTRQRPPSFIRENAPRCSTRTKRSPTTSPHPPLISPTAT